MVFRSFGAPPRPNPMPRKVQEADFAAARAFTSPQTATTDTGGTYSGPPKGRVLVALSGGVDSAVCAKLLQQQGYTVEALVIAFSTAHAPAVAAAKKAAAELAIPLYIAHVEDAFAQLVITPFCVAYAAGRTPNPCVVCNPLVKFATLAAEADRRGIPTIATGHYAQMALYEGTPHIHRAKSAARDQSYMLYRLPPAILSRLLLPLGAYEKDDIRRLATGWHFTNADAPDSQEICFITDGDYATYLEAHGVTAKQGNFIAPDGTRLGAHRGVHRYTVGQRRGLGLSLGQPAFVKCIEENGDIRLGYAGEEYAAGITLCDMYMTGGTPPNKGETFTVKVRSAAKAVPCTVTETSAGGCTLTFGTPQRAPAPGQHAVLYHDDFVVGGGVIDTALDSSP